MPNADRHVELSVPVRSATRWIAAGYGAAAVLLVVLAWLTADAEVAAVRRLTSLRRSDGLASWVVASLAVVVALLAWQVLAVARRHRVGWGFVAVAAGAVALDRGTRVTVLLSVLEHESLGLMTRASWFLPWAVAGLIAFLFLWRCSAAGRGKLMLAAAGFAAAGSLELFADGEIPGSIAVLCNGAALAAMLVALLEELASRPDSLRWSPSHEDRRRYLRRLSIAALATFATLCAVDLVLAAREGVNPVLRRYLNPASEASLASWLATTQTLLLALTLWMAWRIAKASGSALARGWLVLAVCFTYMSLDDGAMVHERVATMINAMRGWVERFPSYTWQFVYLPLLSMLGAFVVFFLWSTLRRRAHRALVITGLGCLVFAVGLDFVEGLQRVGESEKFRHASKVIEETIEMVGVHLIWVAVLAHGAAELFSLGIRLERDQD